MNADTLPPLAKSGVVGVNLNWNGKSNLSTTLTRGVGTALAMGFAEIMAVKLQCLPKVAISLKESRFQDGEMFFLFSKAKIHKSAKLFRYSIALKFMQRRPSLDHIRSFIKNRWGLNSAPAFGQLKNPKNVLVQISNEKDFISVMCRGNLEILGVVYRVFHWTPDFLEEEDSPWVPVWMTLLGLPPNFFQESMLQSIGVGSGRYLKRDKATDAYFANI